MSDLARRGARFLVVAACGVGCLPSGDLSTHSREFNATGGNGAGGELATPSPGPEAGVAAPADAASPPPGDASVAIGGAGGSVVGSPEPDASPSALDAGGGAPGAGDAAPDAAPLSACGAAEVTGPNGNCFIVLDQLVTWAEARNSCQARGAGWDLAVVRSNADSEFWAERLSVEAWLGGSDAATEGTWVWVVEGDAFWSGDAAGSALNGAYTNWNGSEPNGGENSDCVRVLPRTAEQPDRLAPWADLECSDTRAALCEGPPTG